MMLSKLTLKKLICIALCVITGLLCCGCNKKAKTPVTTAEKASFSWLICDPYSKFSGNWSQYSVLKTISSKTNIEPHIELVTENIDRTVATCLLSDSMPDAITVRLDSESLKKIAASFPFSPVSQGDVLYESIPSDIRRLYTDSQGALSFIPGGFATEIATATIADEGVYILTDFYKQLDSKAVTDLNSLVSLLSRHQSSAKNADAADFILLGSKSFYTIEHLFGILPEEITNFSDIKPTRYDAVTAFLGKLQQLGASKSSIVEEFSPTRYPIIYIGESAAVERWNNYHGKSLYTELSVFGSSDGFVSGYSKNGCYATFIKKGDKLSLVKTMLQQLLTRETSLAVMYGERNTDWLIDENTGQIVIPSNTVNRMKMGDATLVSEYGLGVFPYLSSQYSVFSGFVSTNTRIRDLQQNYIALSGDPTESPYKELLEKRLAVTERYLNALG